MILDQYGKPIPEPQTAYDAILADFMGDAVRQILKKRDAFAAFDYSRLVDARGKTLPSTKQYTFKGRAVRCPVTVR